MPVKLTEDMVVARSKGSDLHNIRKLNCWGSELSDVSVIRKLPNVEVLSLSVNQITTLVDFQWCSNLQELYIRKNNIKDINELLYLRQLPKLKSLWLADNPCAQFENYRLTVLRALPHLQKLDNVVVEGEEVQKAMVCGTLLPLGDSAAADRGSDGRSSESGGGGGGGGGGSLSDYSPPASTRAQRNSQNSYSSPEREYAPQAPQQQQQQQRPQVTYDEDEEDRPSNVSPTRRTSQYSTQQSPASQSSARKSTSEHRSNRPLSLPAGQQLPSHVPRPTSNGSILGHLLGGGGSRPSSSIGRPMSPMVPSTSHALSPRHIMSPVPSASGNTNDYVSSSSGNAGYMSPIPPSSGSNPGFMSPVLQSGNNNTGFMSPIPASSGSDPGFMSPSSGTTSGFVSSSGNNSGFMSPIVPSSGTPNGFMSPVPSSCASPEPGDSRGSRSRRSTYRKNGLASLTYDSTSYYGQQQQQQPSSGDERVSRSLPPSRRTSYQQHGQYYQSPNRRASQGSGTVTSDYDSPQPAGRDYHSGRDYQEPVQHRQERSPDRQNRSDEIESRDTKLENRQRAAQKSVRLPQEQQMQPEANRSRSQRSEGHLKSPDSLHEDESAAGKEAYAAYRRQIREQRHQQRQEPPRSKHQGKQSGRREEEHDTDRELQSYMERHRPERRPEKPERRPILSESQERLYEQDEPASRRELSVKEQTIKQEKMDKILLQEHYIREMELAKSKQQRIDEAFQAKPSSQPHQYAGVNSPSLSRASGSSPALLTHAKGHAAKSGSSNTHPSAAKSEQTLSSGSGSGILSPPPLFSNSMQRFDFSFDRHDGQPISTRRPECPSPNRMRRPPMSDGYDVTNYPRFPSSSDVSQSGSFGRVGSPHGSAPRTLSPHPSSSAQGTRSSPSFSSSATQIARASPAFSSATQMPRSTSSPQFSNQEFRSDSDALNDASASYAAAVAAKNISNLREAGM